MGAHIIVMKNIELSAGCPLGAACSPNASASVSKHCVPVHTLLLWSVSMTSCTPGRCAPPPFMQTQFIKSSQLGIFFVLRRCCK